MRGAPNEDKKGAEKTRKEERTSRINTLKCQIKHILANPSSPEINTYRFVTVLQLHRPRKREFASLFC